jgi:transposase
MGHRAKGGEAMKTVTLDVHTERTQLCVSLPTGEVVLEKVIATKGEVLRREIGAIDGPKRVVLENGPWAALVVDAVREVADEVVACDPTRNALIARAEDANDERDARRLGVLSRAGAVKGVFIPVEPYRTIRSLVSYEYRLTRETTRVMLQIKGAYRRQGVSYRGKEAYRRDRREVLMGQVGSAGVVTQLRSLYRVLDTLRVERVGIWRALRELCGGMGVVRRLQGIPGVGPRLARVILAWIVDPGRFRKRSAVSAYGGLGLVQGVTNWRPTGRAHASRRGQRQLKRALFLAARVAVRGENGLGRRYRARREAGWEDRKAIRDVARQLLFVICHVWRTGEEYDDARISVPVAAGAR